MWMEKHSLGVTGKATWRSHAGLDTSFGIGLLYRVADLVAVGLSGVLAHSWFADQLSGTFSRLALVVGILLAMVIFPPAKLYESWRGRSVIEQAGRLFGAWLVVIVALVVLAFMLDLSAQLDRDWLLGWFAGGGLLLAGFRSGATLAIRRVRTQGWNHKKVLVVGGGDWARSVIDRLGGVPWLGLDVVAIVDEDEAYAGQEIRGLTVGGHFSQLPSLVDELGIDEVWICLPVLAGREAGHHRLDKVLETLQHSTITVRLVPNLSEMRLVHRPMTSVAGLPVFDLNVSPMRIGVNRVLKAVEDRVVAFVVLVVGSPIFLLLAVAVKLSSPGPVFFKQLRHGWDGRPIKVYKFRTMVVHEERRGQVTQASRGDTRVTRVGAFLRRTSLDEIPQFINVLQGRMSVVGPRPHAIEHNHYYMDRIDSYMQRHKVKPGITGWAQVNGLRGETDTLEKMQRRVEHDLFYIDNWSLGFDLRIILMTVLRGFVDPNAY